MYECLAMSHVYSLNNIDSDQTLCECAKLLRGNGHLRCVENNIPWNSENILIRKE